MAVADPAVGLFRALLAAHLQMMWNRMRKGLGRRGMVGMVLVLVLLVAGAVPLFVAYGFLGLLFGRAIEEPLAASLMGFLLASSALGFGVIGGLMGGARQLTWDAYRSFPVPFRTLFAAETIAGFGDLVVLAFVGVSLALGGAFCWASPVSAPFVLLLLGQLVFWVLFAQHLVGSLAVSAVRRLRRGMTVLVIAAWVGASLVASAARELRDGLQGAQMERLQTLWNGTKPLVNALPPVLSVRGMVSAKHGAILEAGLFQLPMLAGTLLLGAVSYVVLRREARPSSARDPASAASEGWFRGTAVAPFWSLARLHLHHVSRSLQGRFGLIVPLITVVLIKGPLGAAGVGQKLTLPGSVIYLALSSTQFHFNQFGLDGQGVKTLFLLPVGMRDLLLGKALGILAYAAAQSALLFALLAVILRPSPVDALAAALLGGCLAIAHVLEGHWLSALYPRPLSMSRMNAQGLSTANLLPLGAGLVNATIFGGVYALAWSLPRPARVGLLAALLLALVALYRALLPSAARFVSARRETVVEVLG